MIGFPKCKFTCFHMYGSRMFRTCWCWIYNSYSCYFRHGQEAIHYRLSSVPTIFCSSIHPQKPKLITLQLPQTIPSDTSVVYLKTYHFLPPSPPTPTPSIKRTQVTNVRSFNLSYCHELVWHQLGSQGLWVECFTTFLVNQQPGGVERKLQKTKCTSEHWRWVFAMIGNCTWKSKIESL